MREMRSTGFILLGILFLLTVPTLSGCREDVVSGDRIDRPFSLYGILNPRVDRQTIVVFPVETERLELRRSEPLDAVVRSTDLETGEVRVWRDSVVTGEHGDYDHVFWSDFRPEFGRSYLIEAIRNSDGAMSSAVANVPPFVDVGLQDRGARDLWVHLPGGDGRFIRMNLRYDVRRVDVQSDGSVLLRDRSAYTISYVENEISRSDGRWFRVNLVDDVEQMRAWYALEHGDLWFQYPTLARLGLVRMALQATIGEAAWDPSGGIFDPDVVNHPGAMSNVENGFGFVGGGYRLTISLYPARETLEGANLYDLLERPGGR